MPKATFFNLPGYGLGVAILISPIELTPNHEFIGVTPGSPAYEVYLAPDGVYECFECLTLPATETETEIPPVDCELPFM